MSLTDIPDASLPHIPLCQQTPRSQPPLIVRTFPLAEDERLCQLCDGVSVECLQRDYEHYDRLILLKESGTWCSLCRVMLAVCESVLETEEGSRDAKITLRGEYVTASREDKIELLKLTENNPSLPMQLKEWSRLVGINISLRWRYELPGVRNFWADRPYRPGWPQGQYHIPTFDRSTKRFLRVFLRPGKSNAS